MAEFFRSQGLCRECRAAGRVEPSAARSVPREELRAHRVALALDVRERLRHLAQAAACRGKFVAMRRWLCGRLRSVKKILIG